MEKWWIPLRKSAIFHLFRKFSESIAGFRQAMAGDEPLQYLCRSAVFLNFAQLAHFFQMHITVKEHDQNQRRTDHDALEQRVDLK